MLLNSSGLLLKLRCFVNNVDVLNEQVKSDLKGDVPMSIDSDKRCGKLYSSLINLLEIAKEIQTEKQDAMSCLPKLRIAKEFATVKLCTTRGAGHTSAIAKLIEEKLNKVVLVFPTMQMSKMFENNFPHIKDKIHFCSPNSFDRILGLGEYEAVIVDCSSLISQSKIDELYNLTANVMKNPIYIFME